MQRKKLRRTVDLGLHVLGRFGNKCVGQLWFVCFAGGKVKRDLMGPQKYPRQKKVPGSSRLPNLLGKALQELFAGDRKKRCSHWK